MQNRIVEIASDGAYLSVARGFLVVKIAGNKGGQVAIDDMAALVIRGHGASFSINICARLSEANVPIVLCGADQRPASVIWPVAGHFEQGLRMQAQADAKKTLRKRLWAQLVAAKVRGQAAALQLTERPHKDLIAMAKRIKSGDAENIEAQAARRYWPRLMGIKFRRNRDQPGVNAALNYGYSVLRAATARSILAAGLHPSLSLHHQSRGEALRLADDLMEPFRPWVDLVVHNLFVKAEDLTGELEAGQKQKLVEVLAMDLQGPDGFCPLQICIDRLAQSLVRVFLKEQKQLEFPGPPLPLSAAVR